MTRDPRAGGAADLSARVELRLDAAAPPGDVVPALARLLRRLRDREHARQLAAAIAGQAAERAG